MKRTQTPPPSARRQTRTDQAHRNKPRLPYVIIGAVFLALVLLGGYVVFSLFFALAGISNDCTNGRAQLASQTQSITNEFNAIVFVPDQTSTNSPPDTQAGDCVDSRPAITIDRTLTTSADAGTTFDSMSAALIKAGYTPDKDDFPELSPCLDNDRQYDFRKDDDKYYRTVAIQLTCATAVPKDGAWRQVPVTKATASLTVEWFGTQK